MSILGLDTSTYEPPSVRRGGGGFSSRCVIGKVGILGGVDMDQSVRFGAGLDSRSLSGRERTSGSRAVSKSATYNRIIIRSSFFLFLCFFFNSYRIDSMKSVFRSWYIVKCVFVFQFVCDIF